MSAVVKVTVIGREVSASAGIAGAARTASVIEGREVIVVTAFRDEQEEKMVMIIIKKEKTDEKRITVLNFRLRRWLNAADHTIVRAHPVIVADERKC